MSLSELVGTDLVQAVPLVASAAIGHLLFGNFKLGLTVSILIGSLPGVFIGARFSSRAPDYVIRPSLSVVLLLSGMKLIGASNLLLALVAPLSVAVGLAYALSARRNARRERAGQVTEIALVNGTSSVPLPAVATVSSIRGAQHRGS
jgi:uncharacterized protein